MKVKLLCGKLNVLLWNNIGCIDYIIIEALDSKHRVWGGGEIKERPLTNDGYIPRERFLDAPHFVHGSS